MENRTQQIAGNHEGEEEGRRGLFVQIEVNDTETQVRHNVVDTGKTPVIDTGVKREQGDRGTQGGNFQKQNSFTSLVSVLV